MDDIQALTQVISSIKQEENYFKDYIFPVASSFFSSFIGALLAYFVFHRQERIVEEKLKLDNVNKWLLLADELHQSLIAIKFNYYDHLKVVLKSNVLPIYLSYSDYISIKIHARQLHDFLSSSKSLMFFV